MTLSTSLHGGHTGSYCDHASGDLEALVCSAISKGFKVYGLTEHMPRRFSEELYPEEKERLRTPEILLERFHAFVEEAKRLQEEYSAQIHLLVGLETECLEQSFSFAKQLYQELQLDYIVGSVHHVRGIPIDYDEACYRHAVRVLGGVEELFLAYYETQYELMQALKPEVIGHFDLIRIYASDFKTTPAIYEARQRNIDYAVRYDALFEINARAFRKGQQEPYPGIDALQQIRAAGGKLTLGDDSHAPEQVGESFDALEGFIQDHQIGPIYTLLKGRKHQVSVVKVDQL